MSCYTKMRCPYFVDVNPRTGNMDPQLLHRRRTICVKVERGGSSGCRARVPEADPTLKAILPVDVFGQPADLDPIRKLADDNHLCHDRGRLRGAWAPSTKASWRAHLATTGCMHSIPTNRSLPARAALSSQMTRTVLIRCRALRNQGRAPGDTWLQHTFLGYNYRLDEMSAALGVVQMSRLEELLRKTPTAWQTGTRNA